MHSFFFFRIFHSQAIEKRCSSDGLFQKPEHLAFISHSHFQPFPPKQKSSVFSNHFLLVSQWELVSYTSHNWIIEKGPFHVKEKRLGKTHFQPAQDGTPKPVWDEAHGSTCGETNPAKQPRTLRWQGGHNPIIWVDVFIPLWTIFRWFFQPAMFVFWGKHAHLQGPWKRDPTSMISSEESWNIAEKAHWPPKSQQLLGEPVRGEKTLRDQLPSLKLTVSLPLKMGLPKGND